MRITAISALLAVIALTACESAAPDLETERQAILAADAAWLAATGRKDLEQTLSYWTDDATVFAPDMPALKGKAAIREYVAGAFATPGFSVTWKSEEITVAADGKTAWQFASNQVTAPDATGALHTADGKAVVIWRKEPDGAWRAVVDIWNGAGPAAQ